MGGHQPIGFRDVFQGGGASGSFVGVGDVAADHPHGTGPGKIPAQGKQADYGELEKAIWGWGLGVPTTGDSDGGGRIWVDESLCPEEAEYGHTVLRNADDSGPIQEDVAESRGMGC